MPEGYSLPGYFAQRYSGTPHVALAFTVTTLLFLAVAVVENLKALGQLFSAYSGGPEWQAILDIDSTHAGALEYMEKTQEQIDIAVQLHIRRAN